MGAGGLSPPPHLNHCVPLSSPSWPGLQTCSGAFRAENSASCAYNMEKLMPAGICCRWSDDVQRSVRWSTRSRSQHSNIRTIDEDTHFFLPVNTFGALGVSRIVRYINELYLLTFLLRITVGVSRHARQDW